MAEERQSGSPHSRLERLWPYLVGLLILIGAARVAVTTTAFNQTVDEPAHIFCGLEWLDRGTYYSEPQHPPLTRIAAAIGPYLSGATFPGGRDLYAGGNQVLYEGGSYRQTLMLARLGMLPFFVAMCWVAALWAKRWFGPEGAILATVLLTTAPPVLGHSALATTDIGATCTIFAAIGSLFALFHRPGRWTAVAAGVCVGLALLSKFSSIPYLAACVVSLVLCERVLGAGKLLPAWEDLRRTALLAVTTLLVCGFVVSAGYRFSFAPLPAPPGRRPSLVWLENKLSVSTVGLEKVLDAPIYPATELLAGVADVRRHNERGHTAYLFGEVTRFGWWYFFPVVLALKTPIPFLLLGLAGLAMLLLRGFRERDWRLPALVGCVASIMLFVMMFAKINIGVRHVLIVYPLLAVAAAGLAPLLRRSKPALGVVAALLIWQATSAGQAHPDYLAYFNVLAGDRPDDYRVDSDLDWGQDLDRLATTARRLGVEHLNIEYFGSADIRRHELPEFEQLRPGEPTSGWVAVSLTRLRRRPDKWGWVNQYEVHTRVGNSINLYYVPGIPE